MLANIHIKALIDLNRCLNYDNAHLQVLHTYFKQSRIIIVLRAVRRDLEVKENQALFLVFT